jgi:DNA-directed RNA polymerase specialized sigma subunit
METGQMKIDHDAQVRTIENYLNKYTTYKIGIKNCQKQLDYMLPSLTTRFSSDGMSASYYIANNTEQVALDRITSKQAIDLTEEIAHYNLIISSIDNALSELDPKQKEFVKHRYFTGLKMHEVKAKMGMSEEKTLYRIRRQVLDKFLISLSSLVKLK